MKKFTFKGVLDGFTNKGGDGQVAPKPPKNEVEETLKSLHFRACKTVRHGFPFEPTTLAHDPVQKLIAIGNKKGHIRILGQPGVDIHLETPSRVPVIQLAFMINNGGLVAAMADDTLVLWNLRQKNPEIVNSVGFQRERLTCVNLPPTSRFAYVGTDRGNVYVVNVSTFDLSGYVVNWNKAIEVTQKRHPGCVVHLSENPLDNSKLLICYENGSMVVWDLPKKTGEVRFTWPDAQLRSASWFSDGKQFMCSHVDGSLTTWSLRQPQRPISHVFPHGKQGPEGKQEPCEPIFKLEWKSSRGLEVRDALVIFSGGLPSESKSPSKNLTLINGKNTTVLEMEHPIIDFVAISDKPWSSDSQDPFAVAVLLTEDLVVLDLTVTGYPCFENPYPMDIHESPVTSCLYLVNCPGELIGTFYQVGKRNSKRGQFSPNSWPIDGGVPGTPTTSYSEIVVTGHADGSVKFWDASGSSLQVLYKLKTGKIFDRPKAIATEDPFAVSKMSWCPEGRFLAVAGASPHVLLFTFHKHEVTSHVPCLEIPIVYEVCDDEDTATTGFDFVPRGDKSPTFGEKKKSLEYSVPLTVRSGLIRKAPGFQIQFVCLTPTVEGRRPGPITALKLNSAYNLLAYGNESGLVIVDMLQRTCLLNMGTPDLYGTADPYQRAARSPKKIDREKEDNADSQNKDGVATDPGSALNPGVKENGCPPVAPPRRKKRFQLPQLRHHNNKDDDSEDLNDEEDGNLLALVRSSARSMSLPVNAESFEMVAVDATGVPLVQPTTSSSKAKAATTTRKLLARFRSADDDQAIYDEEEEAEEEQTRSWRKVKCAHDGGGGDDDENEDDDVGEGMTDVCSDLLLRALAVRRRTIVAEQRRERHHGMLSGLRTRLRPGGGAAGAAAPLVGHVMMGEDVDRVHVSDLRRCGRRDAPVLIHADDEKLDTTFTRSRSSSTSSLENVSSEAIQSLAFFEAFARKGDIHTSPTLWVGTSLGSVLVVVLSFPLTAEQRATQPICISPSGTIFRLKGRIVSIMLLDQNGTFIQQPSLSWKEQPSNLRDGESRLPASNVPSGDEGECQFTVVVSDKQIRVVSLPSHSVLYQTGVTDNSSVLRAARTSIDGQEALVCFVATGHLAVFSLPSLRVVYNVDFLSANSKSFARIENTFTIGNYGLGLYMASPNEIQRFSLGAAYSSNLSEMLAECHVTQEMPEAPKESFLKALLTSVGTTKPVDRDELFGETSGKPTRGVVKPGPNLDKAKEKSGGATNEIAKALQATHERGEKLGQLSDVSERLNADSQQFARSARDLLSKQKDKKWYQL